MINITSLIEEEENYNDLLSPFAMNLYDEVITNFSNNPYILNYFIWLMTHFTSTTFYIREFILSSNLFDKIIYSIQEKYLNRELSKNICWFFSNIAKELPIPPLSKVKFYILNNNFYIFYFIYLINLREFK